MTKNIIIFILLLLLSAAAWWILSNRDKPESRVEKAAKETVKLDVERISRKTDSMGREHAIADETEQVLTQAGLATVLDTASKKSLDSALRLLGIKDKQLTAYAQVNATLRDSLMRATKTATGYEYRDRWVHLGFTTTDSARFSFGYNAELNWMEYWKRKHFLAPKRQYIDVWMSDPRAKINGLKRLRIEPPKDNMGFSVQALTDYSPEGDMYLGIGATLRTGRLRIQGAYLNDIRGNWRPALRANYDLIDW